MMIGISSVVWKMITKLISLYAITSQLSPVQSPTGGSSSGLQVLSTDTFKLQCFQTPTGMMVLIVVAKRSLGVKFYLIADPNAPNLDQALKMIYEIYTDYVLKVMFSVQNLSL